MNFFKRFRNFLIPVVIGLCGAGSSPAAVSVGHVENSTTLGQFLDPAGLALTSGGLTIGYFSIATPQAADWSLLRSEAISAAYDALTNPGGSFGFIDLRNVAGATQAGGFSWSYPTIGGTVQNIPVGALSTTTQMYAMAFNSGTLANSFAGATGWAVATDTTWVRPADFGTKVLQLSSVTPSEVLVGTHAAGNNVQMLSVPEPAAWLSMLGGVGILVLRRKRFSR